MGCEAGQCNKTNVSEKTRILAYLTQRDLFHLLVQKRKHSENNYLKWFR